MDALHRSVCVCFAFIQLCKEIPYDIRNNEKDKKHTDNHARPRARFLRHVQALRTPRTGRRGTGATLRPGHDGDRHGVYRLLALDRTVYRPGPPGAHPRSEGLANNTDLGIARLRVEEAEATLFTSRLAYLPSLTLAPQGQLGNYDGAKPDKTYSIAASAEWEVDLFGRLTNAKRGARAALEQSEAYRQAVQTQLVATIANSYYNLLTLDRQLDISLRTLDSWTEIVRTYEVRKRVGEANEAAVAQALANKLSVEGSVLTLRKQIRAQENSLSALLGRVPGPVSRTTLGEQRFPEKLAVGVPLQLLERRPDVRQAEAALAQAFYNTNAARSAFYPRITLSGSAGWTNNSGSAIINPGNWLLSALGSLTQPLFRAGRTSPTCVSPRHARKRPCSPSAKACSGQATR